ncbi:MAG: DUF3413 domain-containing protein [Candidatus Eisenbacteria bacterium]|uniref:DUF3413 domain-containing protein n=1 Tax=Eiseniibacteriota bacterium TaxID=2212470 RepID=A0A538TEZ7_UNCEI|nr:MAG: DUF3413 domain-containing protein [Candidatus Eisenbacteria bacterium]
MNHFVEPRLTPGAWLRSRLEAYVLVLTVVALHVPFLALPLLRDVGGATSGALGYTYVLCVILGWYALILTVVVSLVFLLSFTIRRVALVASGVLLALALYYLMIDSVVFDVYKFHVDAFWFNYLLTDFEGLGVPPSVIATALVALLGAGLLEVGLFYLARRLQRRGRIAAGFAATVIVAFGVGQAIHIIAYYKSDGRIVGVTPRLPYYSPITSHKQGARYAGLLPSGHGSDAFSTAQEPAGELRYPLRPVPCIVPPGKRPPNIVLLLLESWRYDTMDSLTSPHVDALARRSSLFLHHFSSGNSTPSGVFGLFYGIHPTYWSAVKASSEQIDNPLFIDMLQANHYGLGIFADSHFGRHKIKDTVFRGIPVEEKFAGGSADAKDADLNRHMLAFIDAQHAQRRPFFAFAFYKSTHYSYSYPADRAVFQPAKDLNIALAGRASEARAYFNDYRNSVHYVDDLIGDVVAHLDSLGLMDETIIIVTSDHGEEFDDNHARYWGHGSNFTQFQTKVPMVMYMPGRAPRRVNETTTHVDVPTTLIEEICGATDVRDFSNGYDLFRPLPKERPIVMTSYVNHAFMLGDDVFVVFPMYVQRYKVYDVKARAAPPSSELMRIAMEEVTRFNGQPVAGERRAATVTGTH